MVPLQDLGGGDYRPDEPMPNNGIVLFAKYVQKFGPTI
jgi:hypothetical protein